MTKKKDELQILREFGLVMALACTIVGGILLWKERPATPILFLVAVCFLGAAIFAPKILLPLERVWMKFAEVLSAIMTRVILCLTYYLVITPIGIIMRLLRKDLLELRLEKNAPSYWKEVEADGPGTRPYTPY